jgi:hypothetical protein
VQADATVLFDTLKSRSLSDDACFLCGATLRPDNRSDEHVIPRWAQARFDLWNQELTLLNRTSIPYRQLTVPCCSECNNGALQPIESAVSKATLQGADAVRALDRKVMFTWLGKIFYGLLHRELFLLLSRRVPEDGTITSSELIERYSLHHLLLQNARVPMEFHGEFPASIFVYETKVPGQPRHQWDFRDNLVSLFISVRMGSVGVAAVLQDGGAQEGLRSTLEAHIGGPLHPLQHLELAAMVCYKALLATRTPKYIISEDEPVQVFQVPLAGLSAKPLFDDWHSPTYAQLLGEFLHVPAEALLGPNDRVMSWLRDADGKPKDLTFEECPWPASSESRSA